MSMHIVQEGPLDQGLVLDLDYSIELKSNAFSIVLKIYELLSQW